RWGCRLNDHAQASGTINDQHRRVGELQTLCLGRQDLIALLELDDGLDGSKRLGGRGRTNPNHAGLGEVDRDLFPPASRPVASEAEGGEITLRAPRSTPHNRRGPPSMPRAELGIHGLRSWGRNWSRKVRETRSSSSQKRPEQGQEVLAAR